MYKPLRKKLNSLIKSEKAQAVTEFALLVPILILILTLVVEIASLVDTKIILQNAACESARQIRDVSGDVEYQAKLALSDYKDRLDMNKLEVSVNVQKPEIRHFVHHAPKDYSFVKVPSNYKFCYVNVDLKYKKPLIMPLSKVLFGDFFDFETKFSSEVYIESYNRTNNLDT